MYAVFEELRDGGNKLVNCFASEERAEEYSRMRTQAIEYFKSVKNIEFLYNEKLKIYPLNLNKVRGLYRGVYGDLENENIFDEVIPNYDNLILAAWSDKGLSGLSIRHVILDEDYVECLMANDFAKNMSNGFVYKPSLEFYKIGTNRFDITLPSITVTKYISRTEIRTVIVLEDMNSGTSVDYNPRTLYGIVIDKFQWPVSIETIDSHMNKHFYEKTGIKVSEMEVK